MFIEDLIKLGVTTFYNCYRGNFDAMCAKLVNNLRETYPQITQILVLTSVPDKDFVLPEYFDKSICLSYVKEASAQSVSYTINKLVENVDYIISGVANEYDEAKVACDYAELLRKPIFDVLNSNF